MSASIPFRVKPMLATLVREPFDKKNWVYEEKYDGFRILAYKEGASVQLLSRNAIDRADRFGPIADAVRALPATTLLLDGEVVVFDRKGVSRFQLLQNSGKLVYAVFDCLYKNGKDLRRKSFSERRSVLEDSLRVEKPLLLSRRLAGNGLDAYRIARAKNFEGVVAKDLTSLYIEGRSTYWLKVKVHQEDEFVIGGFTAPSGSRQHFGALLLGAYVDSQLRFVGKVGTGFDEDTLASLSSTFKPLIRKRSDFVNPPRGAGLTFLAPRLVAQISYQELTADRKLRQPVFLGLRDDKSAKEVHLAEASR